ncbi:ROK family protein [Paenibacillus sp. P25]|nr:ROK family protein [Paenibacillus sp. P25]
MMQRSTWTHEELYGVVDIGGTKIIAGIAFDDALLATRRISTDALKGPDDITKRIAATLTELKEELNLSGRQLSGIGVSVPGPLNTKEGIVHFTGNLNWVDYPVAERLQAECGGVRVCIDDDGNCAGIGEAWYGAGKGLQQMVYITISTGIGGAVIIDGQVYRGHQDLAGEIGHMTMIPDGPLCSCGNYGCLESIASGTAIGLQGKRLLLQGKSDMVARLSGGRMDEVSAETVFLAAEQGDSACQAIIRTAGIYLGIAAANLVHVLNPEAIVFGGGDAAECRTASADYIRNEQTSIQDSAKPYSSESRRAGRQERVMGSETAHCRSKETNDHVEWIKRYYGGKRDEHDSSIWRILDETFGEGCFEPAGKHQASG